MYKFFLSYNRDELCPLKDARGNSIIGKIGEAIKTRDEPVYFDNLAFFQLDPQIFANIENIMSQEDVQVLLVSNNYIFYGWTEKEILSAISHSTPIYIIDVKKFIKFFLKKEWSFKEILEKKAKQIKF